MNNGYFYGMIKTKRKKYYKKICKQLWKSLLLFPNGNTSRNFWMENFDIERMLWMKKRKFILAGQG
jgi:hypothetical protein